MALRDRLGKLLVIVAVACATPILGWAQPGDASSPSSVVEYVIGVEDVLDITVWREEDVTLRVTVRPDGKITVPLVGDIQAAGRTANEIATQLKEELSRYIKEPIVAVIVSEINSFRVYVIGEVNSQGVLELRQRTRLLQALALARGLTEFADKSDIVLIREENGRIERMQFDYKKLVRDEHSADNIFVKPGDTIIVN